MSERYSEMMRHLVDAENALDRARYHAERLGEEAATPAEPAPEPVPGPVPDPFEGEQPEPIPNPVPVTMPLGEWVEQPEPIVSFTNEQIAGLLRGTPRASGEPRPLGMAGDPNGAFRFIAEVTHFGRFDPVAYPGQETAGHLHQFHGNLLGTFNSSYESLRASGGLHGQGGVLNRSLYWSPPLTAIRLSDMARIILKPTYANNYYKATPNPDTWHLFPEIADWAAAQTDEMRQWYADHPLAAIPDGMRYFAGYRYGQDYYNLVRLSRESVKAKRFADLDLQPGDEIKIGCAAPSLWIPPHVDSPDHMAHIVMDRKDGKPVWIPGARRIPADHHAIHYILPEGIDLNTLALSSDLQTGQEGGTTPHVGYFAAWEPEVMRRLHHHSIEMHGNNASAGIGDGTKLPSVPIVYETVSDVIEWPSELF